MNINQELHSLGQTGSNGYDPTDEMINQLLHRAQRARAVRQSTVALVGSLGAIALGAVAVQAVNAAQDDPAFRDRNIVEDRSNLTPIEKFRAQFGNDNPVREVEPIVDVKQIIADLKAGAEAEAGLKEPGSGEETKPEDGTAPTKPKPTEEACVAKDHPNYPAKTWDCATGSWVVKPGWFWDQYANDYKQCNAQVAYLDKSYDCSKGKWVAKNGFFEFGGAFYPIITWTDAATGKTATGNYLSSHNKVAFAALNTNWVADYKHFDGNASWSGTTCYGIDATIKGAPFKYSCLQPWQTGHDNGSGGKVSNDWIAQQPDLYKWHSEHKVYYCIDTPPAGWTWDGTGWVAVP
jgi:hypothetical protein